MAMTPEEYVAKEHRVPGWDSEEPMYAPGSNPSEQDPNIMRALRGDAPEPEPTPDAETMALIHEYNVILPIALRRAELDTAIKQQANLDARTGLWNALSAFISSLVE